MKRRERERLMELILAHELVVRERDAALMAVRALMEELTARERAEERLEGRRAMLAERLARARLNIVMLTEELERERAAGRDTAMLDHPSAPTKMIPDLEVVEGRVQGVPGAKERAAEAHAWDMENDGGPSF